MRTGHACVLAMVLFGSTQAWGQMNPTGNVAPVSSPPYASSVLFDSQIGNSSDGKIMPVQATQAGPSTPSSALFGRELPGDEPDTLGANASPQRFWLRTDYLLWWIKKTTVPPLIQTIPDSLANSNNPPVSSASTLFPTSNQIGYKVFNGLRATAGMWFDDAQRIGIEASGFVLEQNANGAGFMSPGSPVLIRRYNNVNNNGQPVLLQFSNPDPVNGYSGSLSANAVASTLFSGDLNMVFSSYRIFSDHTDFLGGFRYFDFREHLDINGTVNLKDGRTLAVNDHFAVTNQFYGGQAGMHARWNGMYGFSLDGIFKLAMGGVAQQINISGSNTLTSAAGVPNTQPGGLYAQAANSGTFNRSVFAVIPDVTLNLNYNLTDRAAFFMGYNFLYISNLARISSVINPNVNDSNIRYISNPTPGTTPGSYFSVRNEGMWVQGLNFGVRLEY